MLEAGEEALAGRSAPGPRSAVHGRGDASAKARQTTNSSDNKGKENTHSLPFSIYSALGGLRQDPGRAAESAAGASTCGVHDFRSTCLSSTSKPRLTPNRRRTRRRDGG